MRLEIGALLADRAPFGEAEDLEAAAVGQQRLRPANEAMETAAPSDQLVARAQEQVVGVAEDDLGAELLQVAMERGFDRALGAHRHEGRCLHDAVRRLEFSAARWAVCAVEGKCETVAHGSSGFSRTNVVSGFSRTNVVSGFSRTYY